MSDNPPSDARLDSWKSIADYLRRDVSTVRRWEKHEGLPVHRHLHRKLGSVYAFRSEIDDWQAKRRSASAPLLQPQISTVSTQPPITFTTRQPPYGAVVAAVGTFLALLALTSFPNRQPAATHSPPTFVAVMPLAEMIKANELLENWVWKAFLADLYTRMERHADARRILDQFHARQPAVSRVTSAALYAAVRERARALQLLERACEAHDPDVGFMRSVPAFDSLRREPGFAALLRRTGLV